MQASDGGTSLNGQTLKSARVVSNHILKILSLDFFSKFFASKGGLD